MNVICGHHTIASCQSPCTVLPLDTLDPTPPSGSYSPSNQDVASQYLPEKISGESHSTYLPRCRALSSRSIMSSTVAWRPITQEACCGSYDRMVRILSLERGTIGSGMVRSSGTTISGNSGQFRNFFPKQSSCFTFQENALDSTGSAVLGYAFVIFQNGPSFQSIKPWEKVTVFQSPRRFCRCSKF